MEVFWLIGGLIFLAVYILDRKVLRFDSEVYLHYTKWILVGFATALVIRPLLGVFPPAPTGSFGGLLMVWWEDLLFSLLPIYYARKYFHPKVALITTILASILFALGHAYQSWSWAFITAFYPYYFSYNSGKKYGYGTVMALHITYDVVVRILQLLLFYIGVTFYV